MVSESVRPKTLTLPRLVSHRGFFIVGGIDRPVVCTLRTQFTQSVADGVTDLCFMHGFRALP
jgi:hypothetical protein